MILCVIVIPPLPLVSLICLYRCLYLTLTAQGIGFSLFDGLRSYATSNELEPQLYYEAKAPNSRYMRAAYDILGAHTAKFHSTQHASFPERDGSVQQRATRFVIRVYAAPYWCACFRLFSGATNTILYCIQAVTPGVEAMLYAFHLQVMKLNHDDGHVHVCMFD